MLDVRAELLTVAQVAISIAGFSGVVAAFYQRDGLHEFDRVRIVGLFIVPFATLNLAFAPVA